MRIREFLSKPISVHVPGTTVARGLATTQQEQAMSKILIVDDDESFRKMLRLTLVKLGFEVTEAANGKEAMKRQAADPAELLLTDLIMPDQEGLETIQGFRRAHPAVKIIAMSGGGRINTRDFLKIAQLLGADRTFKKPFSIPDLATAITELLKPPGIPAPAGSRPGNATNGT